MKLQILKVGLWIVIAFGFFWLYKIIFLDTALDNVNPLNTANINEQVFSISTGSDTVLQGRNGSVLIIRKHSLTDCQGNLIKGSVDVHLKEIITQSDIAKSGISTTSNGRLLSSDGMINLRIFKNNNELCLGDSATISLITVTDSLDNRMRYFSGKSTEGNINWVNPSVLVSPSPVITKITADSAKSWNQDEFTFETAVRLGIINRDTVKSPFYERILQSYYDSILQAQLLNNRLYNILEVTSLGWINIDRFVQQNETDPIKLSVLIENGEVYPSLFTKLVLDDLNTYLDGYRIGDSKIVFGKSDRDNVRLPLGMGARLLITCYINKEPYFHYSEFTIREKEQIVVTLNKTSDKELNEFIEQRFN